MLITLSVFLGLSLITNGVLLLKIRKFWNSKSKQSYECAELLRDLLVNGTGLVRIDRIAPEDVFLRARR